MPTVRFDGENESEEERQLPGGVVDKGARELTRVTQNILLSEQIGKFVAGQIQSQYVNENLADQLKGINAIHVSVSWG